ncbi:hypothetical protein Pst134EA_032096 [Puccinia striiformis f. sp. tritici]|uniref:uncharacterized protein n=1 Tax=Puccinia striiformis f. sp. tritici TaxID=168172 RepID=UPI0020080BE4|nr:uncharacterized protein Pst134EA_032096 [Puccinia striiformis f. sp. tritici]KAH9441899.1 hypothetical protein Pst134EA_032096 [Puccinia striiformis f. sp. tritici]
MGNGVLSSLLHLYNHPTSAQSSSATLINYGSDEESDAGDRNGNSHNRHLSTESNQAGPEADPPHPPTATTTPLKQQHASRELSQ